MSAQAVAWALDATLTGKIGPEARLVLAVLADYADADGRGAYPSASTIAERLATTVRSVRRSLVALVEAGLIGPGDERLVWKYHTNARPAVWDLAVHGRQTRLEDDGSIGSEPHFGVTATSPPWGDTNVTTKGPGGDTHGRLGVTALSPKPRTKPKTHTHLGLKGDPKRASARSAIAAQSVPADPYDPRPLGLTDTLCPGCGQPVVKTHHCRASALDASHPAAAGSVRELAIAATPRPAPPAPIVDELPLDDHEPCTGCGTTTHRRPLIEDTGLCLRCHFATRPTTTAPREGIA
jgi:hypothetical protein